MNLPDLPRREPTAANWRCTVFGHRWQLLEKHTYTYGWHLYQCARCHVETYDCMTPDRWPWLTGYTVEVAESWP